MCRVSHFRQKKKERIIVCSKAINVDNHEEVACVVKSCLGTKMLSKWMDLAVQIALDAVKTVRVTKYGHQEIDIKRYCRIEKVGITLVAYRSAENAHMTYD